MATHDDATLDTADYAAVMSRTGFAEQVNRNYEAIFDGTHALCYLHIDHLKYYSRLNGIEQGDEVLRRVMAYLLRISTYHLVGRHAGNGLTFIVGTGEVSLVIAAVNALLPTFGEPDGLVASMGYAVCKSPSSVRECLQRAHFACDSITNDDDRFLQAFEGELMLAYDKRTYVIDHLDEAISAGEIRAYTQPIIRIMTGRICELEVLARWQSERYGFLSPAEFIPELERHRIIHKLDLEVFRLACAQWSEAHAKGSDVPFGINLSRLDFELCDIFKEIRTIMDRYDVPKDRVHIEITESALARDNGLIHDEVRRFRDAGFELYMDDFGSGYSSLGQLARLDFDVVKIDKGLVDDIDQDERARAVLADTVTLVKRLGMQTLCEGVETKDQLEFLRAIGCEKAQGFYISKPVAHDQIMKVLDEQALQQEDLEDNDYYDAIGQISLIEGTSANINGIEASTFLGRLPIAVLEFGEKSINLLTHNYAYMELIHRMGFATFDEFVDFTMQGDGAVNRRALHAAKRARDTGEEQVFDFIVGGIYCSATIRLVAKTARHEAYLNMVTSIENSPQVTEHTLLAGVLETSGVNFFWKDTQRRFLGANKPFLDYYGFKDVEDILGKTDEEIGWNQSDDPFRKDEIEVLKGATITNAYGACLRKGELRRIVATKRPLYSNGAIVGLVGFFTDIGPYS